MVQYRLEEGLLTSRGLSENVKGGEVLASIVMFGLVYALLFWVWVFVLHQKISAGPRPVAPPGRTTSQGFGAAASARALGGRGEQEG
jgi:cytochrome d ubiquinol oxidase subunit I